MKIPSPSTALLRWVWRPLLALLAVLSLEAGILDAGWLRRDPLIGITVPASSSGLRFGATEVTIRFGKSAWPSTLNVSLASTDPGRMHREIDVTNFFTALENGAVGNLSSLAEGSYVLRARVFGNILGRDNLLIEEEVSVNLSVPALPALDRA